MSTLIAIAYPDARPRRRSAQMLVQATKEQLVELQDAVVVEHQPDGKIKLHQAVSTTGAGAAGGALWGGLIGLLFLAPLFGMAVGAASGAMAGKVTDAGVNDDFMKQLGAKLEPGGAALIALGRSDAPDKLLERLRPYGGDVIQTSLDNEQEERLRSSLGEGVDGLTLTDPRRARGDRARPARAAGLPLRHDDSHRHRRGQPDRPGGACASSSRSTRPSRSWPRSPTPTRYARRATPRAGRRAHGHPDAADEHRRGDPPGRRAARQPSRDRRRGAEPVLRSPLRAGAARAAAPTAAPTCSRSASTTAPS